MLQIDHLQTFFNIVNLIHFNDNEKKNRKTQKAYLLASLTIVSVHCIPVNNII